MKTFIFLPPLPRMSGGLDVLLRIGEHLTRAGFETVFVARERAAWLEPYETGQTFLPRVELWDGGEFADSWGTPLASDDIWLVPEGWPHALLPGLRAGCRVVVYVQNWAYLLSEWPAGLDPAKLPVHYLAVSRPVAWHVAEMTGHRTELLRPGIDVDLFAPLAQNLGAGAETEAGMGDGGRLSVAWMPRKNKALARQIREITEARRTLRGQPKPDWVEIAGMERAEVAAVLRRSDVFLATGFPEGCPLPPLEALASGCLCAGFSGFGGWDYMRLPVGGARDAESEPQAEAGLLPDWLPAVVRAEADVRPGNGFWVPDGDVIGASLALERILSAASDPGTRGAMRRAGRLTAEKYSLAAQERRVLELWEQARQGCLFA